MPEERALGWRPSLPSVLGGVCSPSPSPRPVIGAAAAGLSFPPGAGVRRTEELPLLLLRVERVESCAAGLAPLRRRESPATASPRRRWAGGRQGWAASPGQGWSVRDAGIEQSGPSLGQHPSASQSLALVALEQDEQPRAPPPQSHPCSSLCIAGGEHAVPQTHLLELASL